MHKNLLFKPGKSWVSLSSPGHAQAQDGDDRPADRISPSGHGPVPGAGAAAPGAAMREGWGGGTR